MVPGLFFPLMSHVRGLMGVSMWWKDVLLLEFKVEDDFDQFANGSRNVIGHGLKNHFWQDEWKDFTSFLRLF